MGENDTWGHGGNVRSSVIEIPLLIYDEKMNWYNNTNFATLKDIAPTLAKRIDTEIPACWEGRSLGEKEKEIDSVKIKSVEKCKSPFGMLYKKRDTIMLKIFNSDGIYQKTEIRSQSGWKYFND